MKPVPAILVCDTREQLPYTFKTCTSRYVDFAIARRALGAGDYGAALHADDPPAEWAVVERKTVADLCGTLTGGRDRFEAELERLGQYGYACIIVEGGIADILAHCAQPGCGVNPKSILASLTAFAQRHHVHPWFAGSRRHAEALTFRILERWVRDRAAALAGQRMEGVVA